MQKVAVLWQAQWLIIRFFGAYAILVVVLLAESSMVKAEELHQITGFRQALFGMTLAQVEQAVVKEFGPAAQLISVNEEGNEWQLHLSELAPGPGSATIAYHFAKNSQTLERINVMWRERNATDQQRDQIGIAAMQLAKYFADLSWKPKGAITGVSLKPGEVATFMGVDPNDASVLVIAQGVRTTDANGQTFMPNGDAILSVTYTNRVNVEP